MFKVAAKNLNTNVGHYSEPCDLMNTLEYHWNTFFCAAVYFLKYILSQFRAHFLLPAWLHGKYRYLRIPYPRQRVLAWCTITLTGSVRIRVQIHQYSREQHQTFIKIIRRHTHGDASHQHDNLLWRYPLTKGWNAKLWSHRRLFPTVYKIYSLLYYFICFFYSYFFVLLFSFFYLQGQVPRGFAGAVAQPSLPPADM